jgi:hypothetical protein
MRIIKANIPPRAKDDMTPTKYINPMRLWSRVSAQLRNPEEWFRK